MRLDAKSIEKVLAKPHEMISAAANVALHADRFEDYERRKMWNTWALETYQKVTAGMDMLTVGCVYWNLRVEMAAD